LELRAVATGLHAVADLKVVDDEPVFREGTTRRRRGDAGFLLILGLPRATTQRPRAWLYDGRPDLIGDASDGDDRCRPSREPPTRSSSEKARGGVMALNYAAAG
jgi:hypothetical protein